MLIWRGYGILVAVFAILGYLASRLIFENILGHPLPKQYLPWAELIGMWLGALLVFGTYIAIQRSDKPRTVVDKNTGEEIILKNRHDFFFIPVKYWPYILAAFGILFFFQR